MKLCGWAAVVFALLGLSASLGHGWLSPLPGSLVVPLHLILVAAGIAAAWLGSRRATAIDRERFTFVADPQVTRHEIKLAHQEAEHKHRWSMTAVLAAPLALGYWLAYEFPDDAALARALPAAALVGVALGILALRLRARKKDDLETF